MRAVRRSAVAIAAPLFLTALGACEPDAATLDGPTRLPGGALLVPNAGPGAWSEEERPRVSVGLELGGLEADSIEQFGRVAAVTADARGRIHVLDSHAEEIRVFSREGEYLSSYGRAGEGPGEFRGAEGLARMPSDSVWVHEAGGNRFHLFGPGGRIEETIPRTARGVVFPWPGGWDPVEGLIDWGFDRHGYGVRRELNELGSINEYFPLRVDRESGLTDTFPTIVRQYEIIAQRYPRPFSGWIEISRPDSGAFWFARSDRYRLIRRSWAGDTLMIITREDAKPRPVTEADVDSVRGLFLQPSRPSGRPRIPPPDRDDFMESKPIVSRILVDRTHVAVITREAGAEGPALDVFRKADGVFLGTVELPVELERSPRPYLDGRHLYGVRLGPLDVPVVVRLDVAFPTPSAS